MIPVESNCGGNFMKSESVKFQNGDVVFHRADGKRGIITGILFRPYGVMYEVALGGEKSGWCSDCEISTEIETVPTE